MSENLLKRFLTSIFLTAVLLITLFSHEYLWLILLIIASIICLIEFNNLVKIIWKKNKLNKYLANIIAFLYFIFFIFSAFQIYNLGINLIIFILLISIFSDIGGYVFGKSIGGKKLTKISPNKTVSGALGSFIFSLIPIVVFESTNKLGIVIYFNDFPEIFYLCLLVSLINQLGDLFISLFKRHAKVKDTGSILPGHGGLLDRIDGMIFAIPFAYILFLFS
tara:strand:- start:688 stop:1350 length:663 start_codon:yes stop_codon:yes gene_type:complete